MVKEEIEDNRRDGQISAQACGLKFSILKFFIFEIPVLQRLYSQ